MKKQKERKPSFDSQRYMFCETCETYVNESEAEAHRCGPKPKEHSCICAGCGNEHSTED
jgi:hypothetical protein